MHTVNDQATYIQQYRVSMMALLNSFCVYLLIGYPYPYLPRFNCQYRAAQKHTENTPSTYAIHTSI